MHVDQTDLAGVLILTPKRFGDERGWFSEVWNKNTLAETTITTDFVQDNHSYSRDPGTIRGLHYQSPPHAQAKLVRCGAGAVLDVVVDIRRSSPTYGQWLSVELSAENGRQVFVPAGFLHGFATLTPDAELLYKCSDFYAPECDGSAHFASQTLGIDWQIDPDKAVLSQKDAAAPDFADFTSPFE